jgi:hypothetical protein
VSATVWVDMRIAALAARVPRRLAFWTLAAVALFVSHDAIFLVQVGPGESLVRALRHAGHEYWGVASLALAGIGLAAAASTLVHLRRLRRRAAELGARPGGHARSAVIPTWLRLFAVVALGFLLQENVEHYLDHMHAPGVGILLGPEYPLALPVIALISGAAALLATAVGGAERELLAAIAAALRPPFGHAPRALPRPSLHLAVGRISPLARAIAGRAPPRAFAQHR